MAWDLPDVTLNLRVLDLIGIFAFSLSGALLAVRKRFDLLGVVVLGCVTAVGGGSIRDTLTGTVPPVYLRDETYLWVAILGAMSGFLFGPRLERFDRTLSVFDTLGLALFAVSGALGGITLGFGPLGVVFVGALSGVGGGVIRDVLAGEVPQVLYRRDQLYATAAACGALTVYLLHGQVSDLLGQLLGALVVIGLRWLSRRGRVRLPVRRLGDEGS
ncbi:trimeric intracellular cation channel family protein [Deinococcus peraridilitoris]|uniref:Putative membrane protein n=1 Tax=Deinococcus peraridilitoris (strain DSM 19664 / LMG 22246 / CIP 109416 / KR-200) TaxID=937777 RepID=L0A084_DEIPD|nr:trimeric intracellular cation channel family protein [Deinococcus peraridilitoris]AFZ66582.1 putative membrane protein [Deinococcus peraridilitoris DSM 19664]